MPSRNCMHPSCHCAPGRNLRLIHVENCVQSTLAGMQDAGDSLGVGGISRNQERGRVSRRSSRERMTREISFIARVIGAPGARWCSALSQQRSGLLSYLYTSVTGRIKTYHKGTECERGDCRSAIALVVCRVLAGPSKVSRASVGAGAAGQHRGDRRDQSESGPVTAAFRAERALRSAPVVLMRGVGVPASTQTSGSRVS
jgi:hypothetical protein